MAYQNNFLNADELTTLRTSASAAALSVKSDNRIELQGVEAILAKVAAYIQQTTGQEVEHLFSYVFLASESTMNYGKPPRTMPSWHVDGTSQWVDGDCFNAWIPLYNDSSETGMAYIPESENQALYAGLGDQTSPLQVFTREKDAALFGLLPPGTPEAVDMILIRPDSGLIMPIASAQLNIERFDNPTAGDLGLFRQSEVHGGFHQGGIRIQLSLKFRAKDARLNRKATNLDYNLFENLSRNILGQPEPADASQEFAQFDGFLKLYAPGGALSKHETLKVDTIRALLNK